MHDVTRVSHRRPVADVPPIFNTSVSFTFLKRERACDITGGPVADRFSRCWKVVVVFSCSSLFLVGEKQFYIFYGHDGDGVKSNATSSTDWMTWAWGHDRETFGGEFEMEETSGAKRGAWLVSRSDRESRIRAVIKALKDWIERR